MDNSTDIEDGVRLIGGMNLNDLDVNNSTNGAEFVVDLDSVVPESLETSNKIYFNEDIMKYLNPWPDEDDSDSYINVTDDGGIKKKIKKPGIGPLIPENAKITVHYSLFEEFNDEPFDSTRLRSVPHRFRLGQGMVIPAFEFMLNTMRKGEIAHYLIQPHYGFGELGCPPRIQPNVIILCEMEVLGFSTEPAGFDDYHLLTEEELKNVTLNDVLEASRSEKENANQFFKMGQIRRCITKYNRAITFLEKYHNKDEEEENKVKSKLLPLYLNMALANLKLSHSGRAITFCRQALEIEPDNIKALFRYGQALIQLGEFSQAKLYLLRTQKLKPTDIEIGRELKKLEEKKRALAATEKAFYAKMLSKNVSVDEKTETSNSPEKEKPANLCSDFVSSVEKRLQNFKEDSELMEIPFPSTNFTTDEIGFIIDQAESIGLTVSCKKVNGYNRMKIFKKEASSP